MTRDVPSSSSADDGLRSASEQRRAVRQRYGSIAAASDGAGEQCCGAETTTGEASTDCGEAENGGSSRCGDAEGGSHPLGYASDDVESVVEGADLGLGCGNPKAIARLREGETVLDLGSGGGFDCFLAAGEVGETGQVIGVDMTPEMVERARANVEKNGARNVEFRLGEIEQLPVADESVDVVISNCVVNLSPDEPRVFREAYRVLSPGGRLAITDVVSTAEFPDDVRGDPESVAACVAGASPVSDLEATMIDAGFADVTVEPNGESEEFIREWDDERDLSDYVVAATIEARKPPTEARPNR